MKLTRLQICVVIMGIALIGIHAAPIVEANPIAGPIIKEGIKHLKDFAKALTKVLKSGEINAAHKSVEKAIQKIKEDPLLYGLAAAEAANLAKDGVVTLIEIVDSTAYDVAIKLNDDDQRFDIYVNNDRVSAVSYAKLVDLNEEDIVTKLKDAADNAITEYQARHPNKGGT